MPAPALNRTPAVGASDRPVIDPPVSDPISDRTMSERSIEDQTASGPSRGDTSGGDLPTGAEKVRAVRTMFDTISGRYDLVNRIMTFGLDARWRRKAVARLALGPGSVVADIACGTGDLCRTLGRAELHAIGVDFSRGMLEHAKTTAPLVHADGLVLPFPDSSVDGAISGFALRNFVDLDRFFAELGRVVRPGGRVSLLDVAAPTHPVLAIGHRLYFGKVVPVIGGLLSDAPAYRYLPKSVAYLPEPSVMIESLRAAGFSGVQRHLLTGGITQLLTATRAGHPPERQPDPQQKPAAERQP